MSLIDDLIQQKWLKTSRIIEAFRKIRRVDFMPENIKNMAGSNSALPIGYNQTISQPLVVAFMMELLQPQPGENILDIGSGSGWTTALLSEMVGERGSIIAIEIVPELKEFGEKNVSKYDFIKKGTTEFICADGSKGYKKQAPYDKILASASAERLPQAWKNQLKVGGMIVTPIKTSIWSFSKESEEKFVNMEYPGFVFVPLISS